MEHLLPIVAGCRAIATGATNARFIPAVGTEVTVIRKSNREGWWDIDSPLLQVLKSSDNVQGVHCPEEYLFRIDGGDFKHEQDLYEIPLETMK